MTEGVGTITFWGFSPAFDILKGYDKISVTTENEVVNILLIGAGDPRHILQTVSCAFRHNANLQFHFYVLENNIELYARYLVLLSLCALDLNEVGLQEKMEMYLELFGNILIRAKTNEYLQQIAKEAILMVTNEDYAAKKLPCVDLQMLKFKERDFLECIIKMWLSHSKNPFDAATVWDMRLRQYLKTRYDAIPQVFDWDCSMVLHDRGASIIHSREYAHWRHKGVAYELREAAYDVSNRTFMSGLRLRSANGDSSVRVGYWGDIVCSPYLGWGICSENESLFKKSNNSFTHGAADVAEFNMLSLFYRIAYGTEYIPPDKSAQASSSTATITELPEENADQETLPESTPETDKSAFHLNRHKVHFLSLNSLTDISRKQAFRQKFHHIFISNSMAHLMQSERLALTQLMHDNCQVFVESALLLPEVKKEQVKSFTQKIQEFASSLHLKETMVNFNPLQDPMMEFRLSSVDRSEKPS